MTQGDKGLQGDTFDQILFSFVGMREEGAEMQDASPKKHKTGTAFDLTQLLSRSRKTNRCFSSGANRRWSDRLASEHAVWAERSYNDDERLRYHLRLFGNLFCTKCYKKT